MTLKTESPNTIKTARGLSRHPPNPDNRNDIEFLEYQSHQPTEVFGNLYYLDLRNGFFCALRRKGSNVAMILLSEQ